MHIPMCRNYSSPNDDHWIEDIDDKNREALFDGNWHFCLFVSAIFSCIAPKIIK